MADAAKTYTKSKKNEINEDVCASHVRNPEEKVKRGASLVSGGVDANVKTV